MVPNARPVNMTDAPTFLRKEGYARGMVQKERLVVMKDAQNKLRREDYVLDITSYQMGGLKVIVLL